MPDEVGGAIIVRFAPPPLAAAGAIMLIRLVAGSGMPDSFGNPGRLSRLASSSAAAAAAAASTTFRRAPPLACVSQPLTLAANLSEQRLSYADAGSGFTLTNMSVLPSPPRHG